VLLAALVPVARAQVAGSTSIGVAISAEMNVVATVWSARKQILGRAVYNENGERIGRVDDLIVAPDKSMSFAIVGAGSFVGVRRHDLAIPVSQFHERDGRLVLDGAIRQPIKALPSIEYARPVRDVVVAPDE